MSSVCFCQRFIDTCYENARKSLSVDVFEVKIVKKIHISSNCTVYTCLKST